MAAISIIVPVYKVPEKYLRKCIESIQAQTFSDIEILLVDDGSPDSCGEICDAYGECDKRIIVIHKHNGGLSSARNAGFIKATSKWVMFVDGDDWIEPDMCRAMYERAEQDKVQLLMCGMTKEYEHTSEPYRDYLKDGKIYTGEECKWLQEQLLHFNGNIAVAYCKLILRDLLVKYNIMHDEILRQGAEGLEFNLRLFEYVGRAEFIDQHFYHYIYNDNSISASHNEANHEFVIKCFEKIKEFIDTSNNKEMLKPWFDNRLIYVIITTAISGYFNPTNTEPFTEKRKKYENYLKKPIVQMAMQTKNFEGVSKQRQAILWIIKYKQYWLLDLLGKIRKWQKEHR